MRDINWSHQAVPVFKEEESCSGVLLIAQLKDSPSPWTRSLPKIMIVKKGKTGEEVAVECLGREWVLNFPNTAHRQVSCPTTTPGAHHNQGHMCACLVCAHLRVLTHSRKEGVGVGWGGSTGETTVALYEGSAHMSEPKAGDSICRKGAQIRNCICREKDTGAVPTYQRAYIHSVGGLMWQRPETAMGGVPSIAYVRI